MTDAKQTEHAMQTEHAEHAEESEQTGHTKHARHTGHTGHTALQQQHPNWHIRRPPKASYVMATRRDRSHVTEGELDAGLCMTRIEDTPDRLREALEHQQKIEDTL